ncbi:MAG TPA: ATP-binding cassette domain-containing protein, partial [Gammaproteobacteria bacterium]|nr:ATP-binding cassette domain-containing protein [Gammaproteobacteria bacterium]
RCGLGAVSQRLIANLSKGYQQRVGIAQAVIHSPSVVVLDEPTVGLDPIQIREIRKLIRELGAEHGVILSTHILPEVQMTCDHVQIINQGELVFNDSIENLTRQMDTDSFVLGCRHLPALEQISAIEGVETVEAIDETHVRVRHAVASSPAEAVAARAVQESWGLFELSPERKSLEQIFVELTSMEHHGDIKEEEAA